MTDLVDCIFKLFAQAKSTVFRQSKQIVLKCIPIISPIIEVIA